MPLTAGTRLGHKARRPEAYRERFDIKAEHSTTDAEAEERLRNMSDEKLARLKARCRVRASGPGTAGKAEATAVGHVAAEKLWRRPARGP